MKNKLEILRSVGKKSDQRSINSIVIGNKHNSSRALWYPILAAEAYLFLTFILFLTGPLVVEAEKLSSLIAFVTVANAALYLGYRYRIKKIRSFSSYSHLVGNLDKSMKRLLILSIVYFIAYGISLLIEYGGVNFDIIWQSVKNPGFAYYSKFDVYERQISANSRNVVIQFLVLTNVLYSFLVPFSIILWNKLKIFTKLLVGIAIFFYSLYFLYIGTLKGLGDLCIIGIASFLAKMYGSWNKELPVAAVPSYNRRKISLLIFIILGIFSAYTAFNQYSRLTSLGISDRYRQFSDTSILRRIIGRDAALGVYMQIGYVSNGYCGLSHSLQTPFVWTYGVGNSLALTSYLTQYLNIPDLYEKTYLARTEDRTGWPGKMYWSTIYPWLASDITYPGTILIMFFLGYFFAKVWVEGAFERDPISLILFTQIVLLIAFIPANNQLLNGRASLWCTISLVIWYTLMRKRIRRISYAFRKPYPLKKDLLKVHVII